jgi:hypothetical protein
MPEGSQKWRLKPTCLSVCKYAHVVAVQCGCDELSYIAEDLLLGALRTKHPVKLKGLHAGQSRETSFLLLRVTDLKLPRIIKTLATLLPASSKPMQTCVAFSSYLREGSIDTLGELSCD